MPINISVWLYSRRKRILCMMQINVITGRIWLTEPGSILQLSQWPLGNYCNRRLPYYTPKAVADVHIDIRESAIETNH